jgi:hypothetical protein
VQVSTVCVLFVSFGLVGCVLVPRTSSTPVATWFLPTWVVDSETCVALQGFVSNSTPLNCNAKNLVARDGCITTIIKNGSDTCL